ncbi:MAG: phage head-tail connector protein [Candidatus Paceibacterota bacterium]|jgi:hypothetical protein
MEELLANLKLYLDMTDDDSEDTLLSFLLTVAGQKILDKLYPFDDTVTTVPTRYLTKQVEIALFLYNKRGAEGEVSHGENGINRTYENADIPDSLMRGIVPYVGSPIKITTEV